MGTARKHLDSESYKATAAVVSGYAVMRDTTPFSCKPCTAGARMLGVAEKDIASGEQGNIILNGMAMGIASEAIAIDDKVSVATGGKFQVAAATEVAVGIAETAASGDGKEFSLRIIAGATALVP